jgi:hypothetical protein
MRASILIRASRALRFIRTVDSRRRERLSKVPVARSNAWAKGVCLAGVFLDLVSPEFSFDAAETAGDPIGGDEDIDQIRLFGGGGSPALVVAIGEGLEFPGIFAADDFAFGVDAGLKCVHGRSCLALGGAGTCRLLGVTPVGVDLRWGAHDSLIADEEAGV